ncbi:MAG: hypothetical protein ACFB0B_15445 [Thermonemataceae bacterium]
MCHYQDEKALTKSHEHYTNARHWAKAILSHGCSIEQMRRRTHNRSWRRRQWVWWYRKKDWEESIKENKTV